MQDGDIAEPDKGLWIEACGIKIKPVGNPVGALSAARGKDSPNVRVAERRIQVIEPIVIRSGQKTMAIKGVRGEIHLETKLFQKAYMGDNLVTIRRAGRRDKTDTVALLSLAGETISA